MFLIYKKVNVVCSVGSVEMPFEILKCWYHVEIWNLRYQRLYSEVPSSMIFFSFLTKGFSRNVGTQIPFFGNTIHHAAFQIVIRVF